MAHLVAVLVDGDNISGKHAEQISSIAESCGRPTVVRVYADAQRNSGWHQACGYCVHHAGTGKNAADILLSLDALELALSRHLRHFVIASSDGDFSHVATRLREYGALVVGVGEAKAPAAFRASCSDFVEIAPEGHSAQVAGPEPLVTPLDHQIRAMIATHSKQGAGMRIADLGLQMHRQHGVRSCTLSGGSWRAYLDARLSLFDVDPRGPAALVRFRPEGFARAAKHPTEIQRIYG